MVHAALAKKLPKACKYGPQPTVIEGLRLNKFMNIKSIGRPDTTGQVRALTPWCPSKFL